jgi:predicted O-linked N-acetylglucosamine transferase (SPINDLY family)
VDGFEIANPSLRREHLNIPSHAIVFLTAQSGYKYNLETAKLQMQIIKSVPNSYFLIKDSIKEQSLVQEYLIQLADEIGVNSDRLKFMPAVPLASIHRANLMLADILLDTYPYNGATTTMETLWMGIPMVTRVGQQFSARNSYTMMINAGITEGIAWTDEEYVDWGIKLGTDENLRQQISWKLRKNRQTAPLWNAKQFTREMENAYQQMWQKYIEGKN